MALALNMDNRKTIDAFRRVYPSPKRSGLFLPVEVRPRGELNVGS